MDSGSQPTGHSLFDDFLGVLLRLLFDCGEDLGGLLDWLFLHFVLAAVHFHHLFVALRVEVQFRVDALGLASGQTSFATALSEALELLSRLLLFEDVGFDLGV